MSAEIVPTAPPDLAIPESQHTVRVRAIDTTTRLVCDAHAFVEPPIAGHEKINMKTMCFLLEREGPDGLERVLFDCGSRKEYWEGSPQACRMIGGHVPSLEVEFGVDEILSKGGVPLQSLGAIVWSHWHWDHIGDGSKFPPSVDIVVGPGFTEAFVPGYPENPESFVLSSDIRDHHLREIDSFPLTIAGFRAHDFFGDGSFYLLDVPGHALGHLCGLARTTPDSFVFMGADCCHYPGAFRPNEYVPMPATLPSDQIDKSFPCPCPSTTFTKHHPLHTQSTSSDGGDGDIKARSTPFYKISCQPGSAYTDGPEAQRSVNKLQPLDADPRIMICLSHDNRLFNLFPLFNENPTSDINDWRELGLKEASRWDFLNELPRDGEPGRPPLLQPGGLRRGDEFLGWTESKGFFVRD